MKKVLEEEVATRSNYATTVRICFGESSGAKASFWLEVLENPERTNSNEIGDTAEGIRETTEWARTLSTRIVYTPYVNCMRCM